MGPTARLVIALGGCLALLVVALLTWVAVRLEALHKRVRTPPPQRCNRVHAGDVARLWFERERETAAVEPPEESEAVSLESTLTAEDLPPFRAARVVDEDEVNPRLGPGRPPPR